jgi:hypothetical protein
MAVPTPEEITALILVVVALCQHGGLLICYWSSRATTFLPRIRRRLSRLLIFQSHRDCSSVLLLHVRTPIRTTSDGALEILVWLARSQDQYALRLTYVYYSRC